MLRINEKKENSMIMKYIQIGKEKKFDIEEKQKQKHKKHDVIKKQKQETNTIKIP